MELTARFCLFHQTVADVKNSSSGFWAFNNRILGLNDFHHSKEAKRPIMILKWRGSPRGSIHLANKLTKPYPQLLYILTMHYSYAVPREAEYYGKDFRIIPWERVLILEEWRRNFDRIRAESNMGIKGRKEFYP